MIKLLIADDEPLVCVGMQSMLNWDAIGIEIVGTARNGQQAADMIESLCPDIVITDIKMPIKTGLELIEESNQKHDKKPLFIILTSFEEFEYARQAVRFRVVDYLIKVELSQEMLLNALNKAIGILDKNTKQDKSAVNLQSMQESFFIRLYSNIFESEEEFKKQCSILKINLEAEAYAVAICEIEGNISAENQHKICESTVRTVRETLAKNVKCYVTIVDGRRFSIAICLSKGFENFYNEQLPDLLERTFELINKYFNITIYAGIGHLVYSPYKLCESYVSAQNMLKEATGETPYVYYGQQGHMRQVVKEVQDYLRNNLGSRLSLNEVAAAFNFSPTYLSRIFAKCTGEGFVEYITSARIEAAKVMLAEGEEKIYEISEKLGFESSFYFSKVFRKVEGVSPREYRQMIRGENNF